MNRGAAAEERAVCFPCAGESLIGVVHPVHGEAERGLLVVVGGPQYRAGSHRQFLLLARRLAAAGIPVMRFDHRGMGDSGGSPPGFEAIGADITAAIDAFRARQPGLRRVVLLGLCDGASAALLHAAAEPRVGGLVLLNPWVRTRSGEAAAYLRHYYPRRLLSADFWRRLLRGRVGLAGAVSDLWGKLRRAAGGNREEADLSLRMGRGLAAFDGPVLLLLSGNDLVAREFADMAAASPLWRRLLAGDRVTRYELEEADHTFSRARWRGWVEDRVLEWLRCTAHC
jgi:exosortase A-associated hydrolase 1